MAIIISIIAREILDSRGEPTIEVELATERARGRASVPAGASVGAHEALELRDGDSERYRGRGVLKAVANVSGEIAREMVGKEFDQTSLDEFLIKLDGTPNKSRLGANALLGVSIAFARAAAAEQDAELFSYLGSLDERNSFLLPQPAFNVLNGGAHAANGLDIQEYMLLPIAFTSVAEKVRVAGDCINALKVLLEEQGYDTGLGDEGGFAPRLGSNEEALDLLVAAIARAGYTADQIKIALDVAASQLYKDGAYLLRAGGEKRLNSEDMLAWYTRLVETYPIISIEDAFSEDDLEGFAALRAALGDHILVVGDDLTVTDTRRIRQASEARAVNAVIIKPNQIGTLSEALAALRAAKKNGWKVWASHRSGETDDTFIADFAVGLSADYLKAGSLAREERVAKYNRLMEIEETLKTA